MKDSSRYLSTESLMLGLMANTSDYDVRFISGENPYKLRVDGEDVFVYIKNLSPAQLSNKNPDIWRVQLPVKEDFDQIKNSDSLFILLGYDTRNDVYTSWNPYWCKQRLNVGKSVSLYSRCSLQQRVHDTGVIEKLSLNNKSDVVCLPAKSLYQYIKNVKTYFPTESLYVAKGSRISKRAVNDPQALYDLFVSFDDCSKFEAYMRSIGMSERAIRDYVRNLRSFKEAGYFEKYKKIFIQYSSIVDYDNAINEFRAQQDVLAIDEKNHGYLRAALRHYVSFMKALLLGTESGHSPNYANNVKKTYNLDSFGKLVELDSILIERLLPYVIGEEYPDYDDMIFIARKHYPQEIDDNMAYSDWIALFKATNWKKRQGVSRCKQEETLTVSKRTQKLRVTWPDGHVVQDKKPSVTFVSTIENSDPSLVIGIDFGQVVISRTPIPDFPNSKRSQQYIESGYWINTCLSLNSKVEILKKISRELQLGFDVCTINKPLPSSTPVNRSKIKTENWAKIRVSFPDGRSITPNKVVDALIEVVKYAGAERVHGLGIICCKDNLILKEPSPIYRKSCKPVGGGWLCNTYSSTNKKYLQINEISSSLELGLFVELLSSE